MRRSTISMDMCMRQFRAAWDRFSADPAGVAEFLEMKRKQLL